MLAGCGSGGKEKAPTDDKPEPKPALQGDVETNAAEGIRYSDEPERTPLWRLRWERSSLTYGEGGVFFGTAYGVHGTLFKGSKAASRFSAASVEIEPETNNLLIKGKVAIETSKPKARLECDSAIWYPEREVGDARGNVRLITDEYTLGPFEAIRFSPELHIGGTPKLFEERHGK